jgi:hypothetical protein
VSESSTGAVGYARALGAVDAVVDGQVILLSPSDGRYHSLDPVGGRIWALLAEPQILDALVGTLTAEFGIDADRCRADVVPFLDRMTEFGLVVRT